MYPLKKLLLTHIFLILAGTLMASISSACTIPQELAVARNPEVYAAESDLVFIGRLEKITLIDGLKIQNVEELESQMFYYPNIVTLSYTVLDIQKGTEVKSVELAPVSHPCWSSGYRVGSNDSVYAVMGDTGYRMIAKTGVRSR